MAKATIIHVQHRLFSESPTICSTSVYVPVVFSSFSVTLPHFLAQGRAQTSLALMGRRFCALLKRTLGFEPDDHRCPVCQRYFISGKRGVQVHLQSKSNVECYNWYNAPPSDQSTSSFDTSSSSSDHAEQPVFESIHDNAPEAPVHADGVDDFDFNNLPPMEFTEEELHPRAEPRTLENHSVKHPTAGAAFGPSLTVLEDIRLNDKHAKERKNNIYYPFASKVDWEVGSWLSRLNVSMELVDEFFRLDFVRIIS